jgi:hypothetical protein
LQLGYAPGSPSNMVKHMKSLSCYRMQMIEESRGFVTTSESLLVFDKC